MHRRQGQRNTQKQTDRNGDRGVRKDTLTERLVGCQRGSERFHEGWQLDHR